jgi:hypothetical protein
MRTGPARILMQADAQGVIFACMSAEPHPALQ